MHEFTVMCYLCTGEDAGDSLLSHTFGIGDLVWGLMRGYTPWPGMVVPETEVKGTVRADEGKVKSNFNFFFGQ